MAAGSEKVKGAYVIRSLFLLLVPAVLVGNSSVGGSDKYMLYGGVKFQLVFLKDAIYYTVARPDAFGKLQLVFVGICCEICGALLHPLYLKHDARYCRWQVVCVVGLKLWICYQIRCAHWVANHDLLGACSRSFFTSSTLRVTMVAMVPVLT